MTAAYEVLQDRVAEYIQYTRRAATIYMWIYRLTRGSIIVLSACAAASATTTAQSGSLLHGAAPVLSLAVSILAALEAWLKPGAVYRAHYDFNDRYISLETKLALIEEDDLSGLNAFSDKLDAADAEYRQAVKE